MIVIFSDGACSGNPGPGGWACVIALPEGRAMELAGRADATTNNRMEMSAVIAALSAVRRVPGPVVVNTDSTYVIGGMTKWLSAWKRRGWLTASNEAVKNEDLWRTLDALSRERGEGGVQWRWIRGHDGHDANERCDELAVAMTHRRPVSLYDGELRSYPYGSLLPGEAAESNVPVRRARGRGEAGPASYLSLADGSLERHATWKECESRVKGRAGVKFKKIRSPSEERAVLKSWGLE
ncbi:MAG: ribonuclease HI [Elusimicrobiota bacterium]